MRYHPLTETDRAAMLATIGVASAGELFADIPHAARIDRLLDLPKTKSEFEVVVEEIDAEFAALLALARDTAPSSPALPGLDS